MTSQIKITNGLLNALSSQISPLVTNLKELGQVTDNNKPAILHLGDVVVATKRVVDEMALIVTKFATAVGEKIGRIINEVSPTRKISRFIVGVAVC